MTLTLTKRSPVVLHDVTEYAAEFDTLMRLRGQCTALESKIDAERSRVDADRRDGLQAEAEHFINTGERPPVPLKSAVDDLVADRRVCYRAIELQEHKLKEAESIAKRTIRESCLPKHKAAARGIAKALRELDGALRAEAAIHDELNMRGAGFGHPLHHATFNCVGTLDDDGGFFHIVQWFKDMDASGYLKGD